VLIALALALAPARAPAREAPLTVLAAPSVGDGALGAIGEPSWAKYVAAWLGRYRVVAFAGSYGDPSVSDCRKAGADYLVVARFALRPQLPGTPMEYGRTAAQSWVHVVDCVTGAVRSDGAFNFESDPLEPGAESPDSRWEREIPAAFAQHPLDLQRPARIVSVRGSLAQVAIRDRGLKPGDVLRDVSTAGNELRDHPIALTVKRISTDGVEVEFDSTSDVPQSGDYVLR
jgi:hypothetical protein